MNNVSAIPDGYSSITPYLIVTDAAKAIDFYKQAFGAIEVMRMPKPDGKVGHAELQFGDSKIMLADEFPEMNAKAPNAFGGSPVGIMLYIENVDAVADKAVSLGATLVRPLQDMFYGDRICTIEDPFGHSWYVATHIEDVSPEELEKRMAQMHKK